MTPPLPLPLADTMLYTSLATCPTTLVLTPGFERSIENRPSFIDLITVLTRKAFLICFNAKKGFYITKLQTALRWRHCKPPSIVRFYCFLKGPRGGPLTNGLG
ncbi:unnamed protein product [Ixodes persulcatus]